ncbi:Shedu anti-phage system protein SduA domain-containing protein [Streptomyces sp. NPDC096132]|uniref:Shedu anti-phage system protein SduA domain-containing protein n=1 Tax=Streptomyces sp. NPDC096132 TaxID=3366075 RepID=UPI00381F6BEF
MLDPIDVEVVQKFQEEVQSASNEKPIQEFLWEHPEIMCRFLGGYCWWIKPEVWLGQEFRLDFLAARTESLLLNYQLVELKSPTSRWFNPSNRNPAAKLVEAEQQVANWNHWLSLNRDYAQRSKPFGLGLVKLDEYMSRSVIVIGQRKNVTAADRQLLTARMVREGKRYGAYTYDSMIEAAGRVPNNFYGDVDECTECRYAE